ncbi:hypothetical protein Xbed_03486 [Xenorhabdus beddingii]|uniref:Uncharacterized protein n=1 Tax=Xenorhabdus beddingii TaxID=40578 RepID=A0A1Y2SCA2_9GAMM|nr:hypothetical protein Xbed_03486 [Xenorhabdus beddingii]
MGPLLRQDDPHTGLEPIRQVSLTELTVTVIEQGTEQWHRLWHTAATLRQRQRCLFVLHQCGQTAIGGLYHLQHTLIGKGDPYRQGIDKHPHRSGRSRTALQSSQQHRTKDHIIAAAGLCQHLRPGDMEQDAGADSQTARLSADMLCQSGIERETAFNNRLVVILQGKKTKGRRRCINIGKLVTEIGFVHVCRRIQRPGDKIAVGQCFDRFLLYLNILCFNILYFNILYFNILYLGNFGKNQLQSDMVADQMVEAQNQQPFILNRIVGDIRRKQRGTVQIEPVFTWVSMGQQLGRDIFCRVRDENIDTQRCLTPDHLNRLYQPLPAGGGTQDIVAVDDVLQAGQERIQMLTGVESQQAL